MANRVGLLCLAVFAALLAATGSPAITPAAAQVDPRPNFVVVVTDDQRWDTIGRCFPSVDGTDFNAGADSCMPELTENLIANGTTFLRGEVTQALCCPSRASILTGQYSRHTGVAINEGSLFRDNSTLATWTDGAGYRTGLVGKYLNGYGLGAWVNYIPPGWDEFHSFHGHESTDNLYTNYPWIDWTEGDTAPAITRLNTVDSTSEAPCAAGNNYSTDRICWLGLEFLRADQTTPFLLYLAPVSPHSPTIPPSRYDNIYESLSLPIYPSHNVVPTPNTPAYLPTTPFSAGTLQRSVENIDTALEATRAVDDLVGVLYDELAIDGRLANTVWVFVSDNGFATLEHRLSSKQCPYMECHRVPYVVVCPPAVCASAGAGVRDASNYALNIDIAPTIADLAGISPTLRVDGRSLVPILQDPSAPWRTEWGLYENKYPLNRNALDGIVAKGSDGSWYKYIVIQGTGEVQLFNLDIDPWEITNLWNNGNYAVIQNEMATRLNDFVTNPTLTITSGPPSSTVETSATISYTSSEAVTFECGLDGAPVATCGAGTNGSVTYTNLALGTHTVTVQAVDAFNNVSAISTVTFTITDGGGGSGPFQLTVTKAGTGTGTVRSTPAGIKCGGDCTETYVSGTSVVLTAKATTGSIFTGWSGGCTGTGACQVSITAEATVTATFTRP